MKILAVGDSGLLGQAVVAYAAYQEKHDVLGVSPSAFSASPYWGKLTGHYEHSILRIPEQMENYKQEADRFEPDAVINCAALADLQDCENDPVKATLLNADLPAALAADCRERGAAFVHVSTDQVFDGKKQAPYVETDAPNPQHIYGKTKLDGEIAVQKTNPSALVLRANIVGFRDRAEKPTFAEWICSSLASSAKMTLFTDYKVSSVYVGDFVRNIFLMLEKKLSGLWHVAAHDYLSKHEFGLLLSKELGYPVDNIQSGRLEDMKLSPPRPAFLAMSSAKAESILGRKFFDAQETVRAIARDFKLRTKEKRYAGI